MVRLLKSTDFSYYIALVGICTYPEILSGFLVTCLPHSAKFSSLISKIRFFNFIRATTTGINGNASIMNRRRGKSSGAIQNTKNVQISNLEYHDFVFGASSNNYSIVQSQVPVVTVIRDGVEVVIPKTIENHW